MLIVDSQVHLWNNGKMPAHHRQVPTYSKDDLIREMDEAGVDAALICPPTALDIGTNDLAMDAARQHPDRLAVMGWFELDDPKSRDVLKTWKDRPNNYGARWAMMHQHQRGWWKDGTLDWLWPAAEEAGVPLAFLVRDNMSEFGEVAARHPGLKLIVDHLGRITGPTDEACFATLPEMLALAKYPNVAVKASGAPSYSSEAYPSRNIHTYLRQIFDAFGPARMFWGTDVTRMPYSYRQCVTMFTEQMPWLTGRDLELVMGRALCDWIGWDLAGIRAAKAASTA
jgi:predicted TIM-barrel fold metal-dependent hydrolase